MDWTAIKEEAAEAIRKSVENYVSMSGMGPWDTPESWIQNEIAQKLKDRFYIMLEIRTPYLLETHAARVGQARLDPDVRSGRIDLALFGKAKSASEAPLVMLIEVKKYARRGVCSDDVIRLRGLSSHFGLKSALLAVLFVCPNEQARQRSVLELIEDSEGIQPIAARDFSSNATSEYCSAVVLEISV